MFSQPFAGTVAWVQLRQGLSASGGIFFFVNRKPL
jgi:hypothetical protein